MGLNTIEACAKTFGANPTIFLRSNYPFAMFVSLNKKPEFFFFSNGNLILDNHGEIHIDGNMDTSVSLT